MTWGTYHQIVEMIMPFLLIGNLILIFLYFRGKR